MKMADQTKIKRVAYIIAYVLTLLGGKEYSKTKIVKLLYLLDIDYARYKGKSFTNINFTSYYYGPYSSEIEDAIDYLIKNKKLTVTRSRSGYQSHKNYYTFELNSTLNYWLTNEEKYEIHCYLKDYLNLSLNELLRITYESEQYRATNFGDLIQMA
jgi:hypothetical protein